METRQGFLCICTGIDTESNLLLKMIPKCRMKMTSLSSANTPTICSSSSRTSKSCFLRDILFLCLRHRHWSLGFLSTSRNGQKSDEHCFTDPSFYVLFLTLSTSLEPLRFYIMRKLTGITLPLPFLIVVAINVYIPLLLFFF